MQKKLDTDVPMLPGFPLKSEVLREPKKAEKIPSEAFKHQTLKNVTPV